MNNRFILSGGPGTGKTTTADELRRRGCFCAPDVARRIIRERLEKGLSPRPEPKQFAEDWLAANIAQYDEVAVEDKPVFFEYSIAEALMMVGEPGSPLDATPLEERPYNSFVFFFPPWPEIFGQDSERDQTLADSERIARELRRGLGALGFVLAEVPPGTPSERADYILSFIADIR